MNKTIIGTIATIAAIATNSTAVALPEINYQCGYTVWVSFGDRDASVVYKGIHDINDRNGHLTCRPVALTINDRDVKASIRNFGDGNVQWQWNELSGTAQSYVDAIAAFPDECLKYFDPDEKAVTTEMWGW